MTAPSTPGRTHGTGPGPAVLLVVRGRDGSAYPGIVDGLRRMVTDDTLRGFDVVEVDPSDPSGRDGRYWDTLVAHVREHGTEYVVLHHFHTDRLPDPRDGIERLKALPHRPLVALSNGDPFFDRLFRPSFPKMFVQAAEVADVVFSSSMGVSADHLVERADCRMTLLPLGACQARFGEHLSDQPTRPEFQVVFIGSNNRARNPLRSYHWFARRREQLVRKLSERFGSGFAVFGNGWDGIEGWQGPVPYEQQRETCRRAEVVVGGVPFSPARYYLSDRPFNQITAGVPFVDLAVEGVETILRDGEHWHLAASIGELVDRCDDLLSQPAAQRAAFGAAAARYVHANHTEEARCRSMMATLTSLRPALLEGSSPPPPDLGFFLPEVDRAAETELATRAWSA